MLLDFWISYWLSLCSVLPLMLNRLNGKKYNLVDIYLAIERNLKLHQGSLLV